MEQQKLTAQDLPNWEAFEDQLKKIRLEIRNEWLGSQVLGPNSSFDAMPIPLLFRGLSDSAHQLTTTLERAGCDYMTFDDYYRVAVGRVKPAVETFTGVNWDVPDYGIALEQSFQTDPELFSLRKFPTVELYRYLVYLRHHGFPSPLLDWSYSPYVAAFFAFRDPIGRPTRRSICVYCETPKRFKGGAVGAPSMRAIGPYVRSHRRHFRQQSDYTICASFESPRGWRYHPHEKVFNTRDCDYLWKFNIPSIERSKVLRLLNDYNLNAFSLFDSEETLLETMWFREKILKSRD